MTVVASFYNKNVRPEVVRYQRAVFDYFQIPLQQIQMLSPWHSHEMDRLLATSNEEYYVFFDIDAIPLDGGVVAYIIDRIRDGNTLFGVAQQSNHINTDHPYAAPSCLGLSRALYEKLGKPSLSATSRGDVAEELTWLCEEIGYHVELIYPSSSYDYIWKLGPDHMFGHGTTYGGRVFHAFDSRTGQKDLFVAKCKEVIQGIPMRFRRPIRSVRRA